MSPPLSAAAAQLLHALLARAGGRRADVTVGRFRSIDWQSLTFIGERHEFSLLFAPDAASIAARLSDGLEQVEWSIGNQLFADIVIVGRAVAGDGAIRVDLEALTLCDSA